jgi:ribosomal protein S18 acetylase RimI-like enzyme
LTTPMTIVIRPYRETDRPALCALTVAAFDGVSIDQNIDRLLGPMAGRAWEWRKARQFEADVAGGAEVAVAAEVETDQAVGYVTFFFQREARIGWINHMAVAAELRGEGLGRRLLEHALARFCAEGMTIAQIETLEQNAIGRHLFPALGFRDVARKIYYAMPLEGEPERVGESQKGERA